MKTYSQALLPGGRILLSGFFETDIPQLQACCHENNLSQTSLLTRNEWALLEFIKN
jgi:ribosomal protein L11 methyltransferase